MKSYLKHILLTILVVVTTQSISAQGLEPIQTDRPDLTESAFTVPAGYFQLESGLMRIKNKTDEYLNLHPTLLLKYGLSANFELRLATDLVSYQSNGIKETQFLPVAVGVKIGITEEKGIIPKTAFIGHLKIPTGL